MVDHVSRALSPILALAMLASAKGLSAQPEPVKEIHKYPYHFDMPPNPNESRQVRRARQRAMRKASRP